MRYAWLAPVVVVATLVAAACTMAAPYRQLSDVSGWLPRAQWFKDAATGAIDDAHFEFYDNPSAAGFPDYPWGGSAGSAAVSGRVTGIQYTPNQNMIGFTVLATVTNDTYTSMWSMNGTSGSNTHGQSAPEIPYNFERGMYNVRLALEFADAGLYPYPLNDIYVVNCDELAWYGYSEVEPPVPAPDPPYWESYSVPTFRFGNLAPGQSATRTMTFGLWSPLPPSTPPNTGLYEILRDSYTNQRDIFANRTSSLGISQYIDGLALDDGASWPGSGSSSSDVSVFFDSAPSAGAVYVKLGQNTPANHYWWKDGPPISRDEMIQLTLTAGPDEAVRIQTMQLQAGYWASEETDLSAVEVYVDSDGDGKVDPGETLAATGTYDANGGICAMAFTVPVTIPARGTVHLVVAYRMKPVITGFWVSYSFNAIRMRVVGVASGEQSLAYGLPLGSCTKTVIPTPRVVSIGEAKRLPADSVVMLRDKVVTTLWYPYHQCIEEQDRSAGIRLDTYDIPAPPDGGRTLVSLLGTTVADWPEPRIHILEMTSVQDPLNPPPAPVAMSNKALGGSTWGIQQGVVDVATPDNPRYATGLNNVGLLVRACGVVTYVYADYAGYPYYPYCARFWIDDGSNLWDGTLHPQTQEPVLGVTVACPLECPIEEIPQPGTYVAVTGVIGCAYNDQGQAIRFLQPRGRDDVTVIRVPR